MSGQTSALAPSQAPGCSWDSSVADVLPVNTREWQTLWEGPLPTCTGCVRTSSVEIKGVNLKDVLVIFPNPSLTQVMLACEIHGEGLWAWKHQAGRCLWCPVSSVRWLLRKWIPAMDLGGVPAIQEWLIFLPLPIWEFAGVAKQAAFQLYTQQCSHWVQILVCLNNE